MSTCPEVTYKVLNTYLCQYKRCSCDSCVSCNDLNVPQHPTNNHHSTELSLSNEMNNKILSYGMLLNYGIPPKSGTLVCLQCLFRARAHQFVFRRVLGSVLNIFIQVSRFPGETLTCICHFHK